MDVEALSGLEWIIAAFVWGALWGSFANVVVIRLPKGESLLRPPSHCVGCQRRIPFYENIPLFSFLLLRGRCRGCKTRFSIRYFLIELLVASLSALLWWRAAQAATVEIALVRFSIEFFFVFALVVLTFIDLEHMILPDTITLPGIVIFFVAGFFLPTAPTVWHRVIGVVCGAGLLWGMAELYFRIAKKEGMGLGDAKLLGMIGALYGWQALIFILFAGSVQGLLVTVPARLVRRDKVFGAEIPFGPFLALAAVEYVWFSPSMLPASLPMVSFYR